MNRETLLTAGLAVIGFMLFLSAVWTARNEAALVPDFTLYTARFVKVAGCFLIALLFRNHIPSMRKLVGAGVVFIALHLGAYFGMMAFPDSSSEYLALGLLSGVFTGVGEACIILVYAHLFSTFEPRMSAVAVPVAYLLNETFYCSTLYMPTEVIMILRPLGKALGIAILIWCLIRKKRVEPAAREYPMQYGMSTKADDGPVLRFLSSSRDWELIIAGATLFPFLFGLIAQICSSVDTNSGLYDTLNEFVAIGLIALLVVYGIYRGGRFTFDEILYVVLPLFATGCLLLPMFWGQGLPYAGLMVKCGYTICQVLLWVLLARKSYDDLRHTYLYFGIFYGLFELTTAAARLIASNLYHANALDVQSISSISLFSLWLIAIYGLLFFAISKHAQQQKTTGAEPPERASAPAEPDDASETFADKLDLVCTRYGLSEREHDVLVETIHGYSMENIGKKLFISRETVKTHLRRVYSKVGVSGKQELIAFIDHIEQ